MPQAFPRTGTRYRAAAWIGIGRPRGDGRGFTFEPRSFKGPDGELLTTVTADALAEGQLTLQQWGRCHNSAIAVLRLPFKVTVAKPVPPLAAAQLVWQPESRTEEPVSPPRRIRQFASTARRVQVA